MIAAQTYDMECKLPDEKLLGRPVEYAKKKKKKGGFLKKLGKKFKKIAKFAAPFASFLPIPGIGAVAGLAGAGGRKKKKRRKGGGDEGGGGGMLEGVMGLAGGLLKKKKKKRRPAPVEEAQYEAVERPAYVERTEPSYEGNRGGGQSYEAEDEYGESSSPEIYSGSGWVGEAEAPEYSPSGEEFDDGGLPDFDAEEDEDGFDLEEDEEIELDFSEEDATEWDYFQNPVP